MPCLKINYWESSPIKFRPSGLHPLLCFLTNKRHLNTPIRAYSRLRHLSRSCCGHCVLLPNWILTTDIVFSAASAALQAPGTIVQTQQMLLKVEVSLYLDFGICHNVNICDLLNFTNLCTQHTKISWITEINWPLH